MTWLVDVPGTRRRAAVVPVITQESRQVHSVEGLNLGRSDHQQLREDGSVLWPHALSGENPRGKLRSKWPCWFDYSLFHPPRAWHIAWLVLGPHYLSN